MTQESSLASVCGSDAVGGSDATDRAGELVRVKGDCSCKDAALMADPPDKAETG
ncbi:hypothetical protein GCM10011385_41440 [Nitratireductor aestuarii]|uniref:Uncharacterized protein n=1 Tax=Nitratireductor aestuarii TaxID=1735103 RepID=A0A916S4F2_9HYPH|nr:hypothetical protein GCM10011385_41440 [Nitratireductor aestuarii]